MVEPATLFVFVFAFNTLAALVAILLHTAYVTLTFKAGSERNEWLQNYVWPDDVNEDDHSRFFHRVKYNLKRIEYLYFCSNVLAVSLGFGVVSVVWFGLAVGVALLI